MSSPKVEIILFGRNNSKDHHHAMWECEFCSSLEAKSVTKCSSCGMVASPSTSPSPSPSPSHKNWECDMCTFINTMSQEICEMCHYNPNFFKKEKLFKFSFRSGGSVLFFTTLESIFKNTIVLLKSGEEIIHERQTLKPIVGIDGLMRRIDLDKKERQIDESSFNDLEKLMFEAERLLKIATSLRTKISRSSSCGNEEESFNSFLMDLGVPSGGSCGEYNQNQSQVLSSLGKDLLRFSLKILQERRETILILSDLFSLFNRARGHSLISPKDMMDALEIGVVSTTNNELEIKCISGLKFLEKKSKFNELEFFFPLNCEFSFVDAINISRMHGLSLKVSLMKLKEGVDNGILVRDGLEKYWKNLFI